VGLKIAGGLARKSEDAGGRMKFIERFAELLTCNSLEEWRETLFALGSHMGYDKTLLAIFPDRNTPIRVENAFLHHSYAPAWLSKYDSEKMSLVDPTVAHCAGKSVPLIWSPNIFSGRKQQELYEEASSYGLRSGVTLPIHGSNGELGIFCLVSDSSPNNHFKEQVAAGLAEVSCFRDFIFESSKKFMVSSVDFAPVKMTDREIECLKWGAVGKSSWEIGQILNCSEATVNFHFANIRRKLNSKSRQQAMVKAIHLGLINPS
jgi:LuxR family quorum-sensing transcriptional regulator LasR